MPSRWSLQDDDVAKRYLKRPLTRRERRTINSMRLSARNLGHTVPTSMVRIDVTNPRNSNGFHVSYNPETMEYTQSRSVSLEWIGQQRKKKR
jgi:hypothetical protein